MLQLQRACFIQEPQSFAHAKLHYWRSLLLGQAVPPLRYHLNSPLLIAALCLLINPKVLLVVIHPASLSLPRRVLNPFFSQTFGPKHYPLIMSMFVVTPVSKFICRVTH